MYKVDLLWVWRVWGVSVIRSNRDPPATPTTSTLRFHGSIEHISGWSCILMTTSYCSRCWKSSYIYKEKLLLWVWREQGVCGVVSILTYSIVSQITSTSENPSPSDSPTCHCHQYQHWHWFWKWGVAHFRIRYHVELHAYDCQPQQ